jgi:hypothetical protein
VFLFLVNCTNSVPNMFSCGKRYLFYAINAMNPHAFYDYI